MSLPRAVDNFRVILANDVQDRPGPGAGIGKTKSSTTGNPDSGSVLSAPMMGERGNGDADYSRPACENMMEQTLATPAVLRTPISVVEPPSRWAALELHELWRYRELLLTLAGRDFKLRYRQTAMGVSWVVLQPLMAAGIMGLLFGRIAKLPSDGVPAFLTAFAGMLGWNAFSTTLTKSSSCLVGNAHLVSKVYFPRIVLPISTIFAGLIDFAVSLPVFGILLLLYHYPPTIQMLLVPVWLALVLALATGIGLFTSALTVQYRDVQYIMPVLVQFLLLASPVGYSVSNIKDPQLRFFYFLNPLAGLLSGFRWSLLGTGTVYWGSVAYAVVVTIVLLIAGAFAFRRMEQRFADVI
jgi:lipopolysaccharide transport system permease protein